MDVRLHLRDLTECPLVRDSRSDSQARSRLSAAERRERILAAAAEVFAEHGYADASMAEIANRAGVVASVLYDHFD